MEINFDQIKLIKQVQNQNPELDKKGLVQEVFNKIKKGSFYSTMELQAIKEEIAERVFNS